MCRWWDRRRTALSGYGRRARHHRADIGQEVDTAGVGLARGNQHREGRIRVGLVRHRGRDEVVVVGREIDLGAAVLDLPDQAIIELATIGCRCDPPAHIEGEIGVAEIVDAGLEIADRLRRRHLADSIDDATRAGAAIKHRRRSPQHLDAFEIERLQFPARIGSVEQLQPIQEQTDIVGLEATDQEPVVAGVGPKGAAADARSVAQGLVELAGLLVTDLLAADDGDRLWNLDQRGVGLAVMLRLAT